MGPCSHPVQQVRRPGPSAPERHAGLRATADPVHAAGTPCESDGGGNTDQGTRRAWSPPEAFGKHHCWIAMEDDGPRRRYTFEPSRESLCRPP